MKKIEQLLHVILETRVIQESEYGATLQSNAWNVELGAVLRIYFWSKQTPLSYYLLLSFCIPKYRMNRPVHELTTTGFSGTFCAGLLGALLGTLSTLAVGTTGAVFFSVTLSFLLERSAFSLGLAVVADDDGNDDGNDDVVVVVVVVLVVVERLAVGLAVD
jgi:ABC-type phosphate/phosphonate transport system permease subunit